MPKRPRQAHVPKQQVARRKPRRAAISPAMPEPEPVFAEEPVIDIAPAMGAQLPVDTRPRRRLELVQRTREPAPLRALAGQLPTYERSYLVRELRTIGMISTGLLGLIILLTLVLR